MQGKSCLSRAVCFEHDAAVQEKMLHVQQETAYTLALLRLESCNEPSCAHMRI